MSDKVSLLEEHREWNREHVYWLEDLTRWNRERQVALEALKAIETHLRDRDSEWEEHRRAMVDVEQELAHHQRALEKGEKDSETDHEAARESQRLQRQVHADLKAKHESIVTKLQQVRCLV